MYLSKEQLKTIAKMVRDGRYIGVNITSGKIPGEKADGSIRLRLATETHLYNDLYIFPDGGMIRRI
jgi:hypothetical protein